MAGAASHWSKGVYTGPNREGVALAVFASRRDGPAVVTQRPDDGYDNHGIHLPRKQVLSPRAHVASRERMGLPISNRERGQSLARHTREVKRRDAERRG